MTDEEFLNGIRNLLIGLSPELRKEFFAKAEELIKRPATRTHQRARERKLAYFSAYNKTRRFLRKA